MTDAEVVAAVAEGRIDALRQLHDRHAPWLAARLYRRCSDQALVDETVQDTFVAVWKTAGRYRGEGDVAAWLWGIAIRRLIGVTSGGVVYE
jgi:RNA polymerase sigma-70 factor (ECF subfamily)